MTQKKPKKYPSQRPLPQQRGRHRKPIKIYDFAEADDRINDIFCNHGFADYPHHCRQQLTQFYLLLMQQQNQDNLTRLISLKDVAIKHFIDSLMITQITNLTFPLLDLGTGPGFPGIPLKIHLPNEPIILAEGVEKRVHFLKKVRDELKLTQLNIIGRYVNSDFSYPVPAIITRAVTSLSETFAQVSQCLLPNGLIYFMKGPLVDQELKEANANWSNSYRLEKDLAYYLPSTPYQRRLLIFQRRKLK